MGTPLQRSRGLIQKSNQWMSNSGAADGMGKGIFTPKDLKSTKVLINNSPVLRDLRGEKRIFPGLLIHFFVSAVLFLPRLSFAQVEDVLAKINGLSGEERQKVLI